MVDDFNKLEIKFKIMGILDFLFGFGRKVRKLRKRWDRIREKSLKKKGEKKKILLEQLDRIENNLRMLEERSLNRAARKRVAKEIKIDLEEVKGLLDADREEFREYMQLRSKCKNQ